MVNPEVKKELLRQLSITPQALSQRAKRLKAIYGPMTTEEAVYVIAHQNKIDLSRHLSLEIIDRLRSLIPRDTGQVPLGTQKIHSQKRTIPKKATSQPFHYPLVKVKVIRIAEQLGGEAFQKVFVLENSIRELIKLILSKKGNNWWKASVPHPVQERVQRTKRKEASYRYRERRGKEPLLYCNFDDLKEIVLANPKEFQNSITDLSWFKVRMEEVYMARNNLAHSIPLTSDDISRILLFHRDWARLLDSAHIKWNPGKICGEFR